MDPQACRDKVLWGSAFLLLVSFTAAPLCASNKHPQGHIAAGLTVSVPAPEQDVLQAVQEVASDGIIQGSKEYNKDEYVERAELADSTPVFPKWTESGRVFYKVRKNALDPRNFEEGGDSGTLAVRYVVQPGDEKNTVLKIDAIFVDDFHRRPHASNGSVEAAEYAAIQSYLASMQMQKQRDVENARMRELAAEELQRKKKHEREQLELSVAQAPGESLEEHVQKLRHEVERVVKPSGGNLRSAPFRSASSLKSLAPGALVVILVSTPYWYGVETEDGQHGWLHHSELEPLP